MDQKRLNHLEEVLRYYDAVFLDVWGVIIDGDIALTEAIDCLHHIRRARKPTILLSNTSRNSSELSLLLETIGVERSLYSSCITAGEVAFRDIKESRIDGFAPPRRCFVLGDQPGGHWIAKAGLEEVDEVTNADCLVAVGILRRSELDAVHSCLTTAAELGLPLLITNPDKGVRAGGKSHVVVGVLAEQYVAIGGKATVVGKPFSRIFSIALETARFPKASLMIGDTFETDILGGYSAGMDTIQIIGRERAGANGVDPCCTGPILPRPCTDQRSVPPTYTMDTLRW